MSAVSAPPARVVAAREPVPEHVPASHDRRATRYRLAMVVVLLGALGLRLWGVAQGLPYAYNTDENSHFVPKAIGMFHDLDPHYFSNPPAFTYLLHLLFGLWFGGRAGVWHQYALNPAAVFVVGRITSAVLGTLAVWLLYLTASRLLDRRAGVLAAALLAVAFLPVFYAHLALNDVPTLAPVTLSLLGTAGVLRKGRRLDYVVAGAGLGLACATKYTGGIVLIPLLAAIATQFLAEGGERSAVQGMALAAVVAVVAFLIADPYSVLNFRGFVNGLAHQSSVSEGAAGKLGAGQLSGVPYYLWTLTWGLGWVPALAASGGAVALWRDERRLIALLLPAPVIFLVFMGLQGRYFGRWLMPVLPIVCVLAAYFAVELSDRVSWRRPVLGPTVLVVAVVALLGQGLVSSIHSGLTLSRADTRNQTRAWMVAHVPVGAHIVVEPVVPDGWSQDIGHPTAQTANGYRWQKYSALRLVVSSDGTVDPSGPTVNIEDYETTLSPALITHYESTDPPYCWIVSGSTQSGRALSNPGRVPGAILYYRALAANAQTTYHVSPFAAGERTVRFNFDWTFDYYPLAYARPGPEMTVYHLTGGRCAGGAPVAPLPAGGG